MQAKHVPEQDPQRFFDRSTSFAPVAEDVVTFFRQSADKSADSVIAIRLR